MNPARTVLHKIMGPAIARGEVLAEITTGDGGWVDYRVVHPIDGLELPEYRPGDVLPSGCILLADGRYLRTGEVLVTRAQALAAVKSGWWIPCYREGDPSHMRRVASNPAVQEELRRLGL